MVKNGLPAIHPGEYLAEILDELGMSQAEFARRIGVSAMRISRLVRLRPWLASNCRPSSRSCRVDGLTWVGIHADMGLPQMLLSP